MSGRHVAPPYGARLGRWAHGAALLAILVAATPNPAVRADDGDARARELFVEGAQRYEAEDYAAAAEAFAASHARRPVPVVLFNLAQALRFAGRPGAALLTFRRYLAEETAPGPRRQREVEAAISELEAEVGALQIAVRGAEEFETRLDGHPVDLDVTRPFPVGAGTHEVIIQARGTPPILRQVEISARRTTVLRVHVAATGTLVVTTGEPGAEVTLDGEPAGRTPLTLTVEGGVHELRVARSGHVSLARSVTVRAGDLQRLDLDLEPERRLHRRWWLWAIVGGVVVGAVAVALAVGLSSGPEVQPLHGTLPTVQALRGVSW